MIMKQLLACLSNSKSCIIFGEPFTGKSHEIMQALMHGMPTYNRVPVKALEHARLDPNTHVWVPDADKLSAYENAVYILIKHLQVGGLVILETRDPTFQRGASKYHRTRAVYSNDLLECLPPLVLTTRPLRDRPLDIWGMYDAKAMDMRMANDCFFQDSQKISDKVKLQFETYGWPGNLAELSTVLDLAFTWYNMDTVGCAGANLIDGYLIKALDSVGQDRDKLHITQSYSPDIVDYESHEKYYILRLLVATCGNRDLMHSMIRGTNADKTISNWLRDKMKKYDLDDFGHELKWAKRKDPNTMEILAKLKELLK